ncbi:MAG: hypothetical protein ACQEV7_07755 [Bacillota bacterium]
MKDLTKLLRLDLQTFAEPEPPAEPTPTGAENPDEPKPKVDDQKIPYDRFKQKVDEANELKRKLAELEQAKADAERAKLEEQNEFKTLYEQAQSQLAEIQAQANAAKREATVTNLLVNAGYTGEQLERVRKYITGDTDEALAESLAELKQDIPPKSSGVDPSVGNGAKQQPQQKDLAEEHKNRVAELLKKKLRRN